MSVLVTGGPGYIGSHMVHALLDRGQKVVVLDNLTKGVRANVAEGAIFVLGGVGDVDLVAGADPKGRTGQSTPRATHLIKCACQAALGRVSHLDIFGTDFPTKDGTGVRDYIHVSDLADVHALALDYLAGGGQSRILNCGYGRGFMVREVVDVVSKISQRAVPTRESARRPGDPPAIVADNSRVTSAFGWKPRHDDLETIIATAFAWERRLNDVS